MSRNKVTFGLEKVHIAFLTDDITPTWDTPVSIPGAVRFSPEPQGEETTFYADNGPYFTYTSNNGYTAELEMANIPDEVLAELLGWEIDANGMLVETTDGMPKEFALLGQILGDQKTAVSCIIGAKPADRLLNTIRAANRLSRQHKRSILRFYRLRSAEKMLSAE